jgi:hypothetical protein
MRRGLKIGEIFKIMFHNRGRKDLGYRFKDGKWHRRLFLGSSRNGGHGISWWLVLGVLLVNGLPETYLLAEQMYINHHIKEIELSWYRISLQ